MQKRWLFILILATAQVSEASWWSWKSHPTCSRLITRLLYQKGQSHHFPSLSEFHTWVTHTGQRLGLAPEFIESHYNRINDQPELGQLISGNVLPAAGGRRFWTGGSWGQDFLFVPGFELWQSVHDNLRPLSDRLSQKRKLHPLLTHELFLSDNLGMGDAAWAMVETRGEAPVKRATVKFVHFDYDMTPDGPWPRYSLNPAPYGDPIVLYRHTRQVPHEYADDTLAGYYVARSSLHHWGLLPLESHLAWRVPEHDPANYPNHPDLFSRNFQMIHQIYMDQVIDRHGYKDVAKQLSDLMQFRKRKIPEAAKRVGEVSRFLIPPGMPAETKAQIFYSATILLRQREVDTWYLLVPRPEDKNRPESPRREPEVVYVTPGLEWVTDAIHEVLGQAAPPAPYVASIAREPLREMYEEIGFQAIATKDRVMGLPNGAHVMRIATKDFMAFLLRYLTQHPEHLSQAQNAVVKRYSAEAAR